jgi:hypothetical protein
MVMYIRPGPYRWYDVATGMVTTELVFVFLIFPRIGWTCRISNFRGFKRLLATGCMRCVDRAGLKSERTSERLGRRGSNVLMLQIFHSLSWNKLLRLSTVPRTRRIGGTCTQARSISATF